MSANRLTRSCWDLNNDWSSRVQYGATGKTEKHFMKSLGVTECRTHQHPFSSIKMNSWIPDATSSRSGRLYKCLDENAAADDVRECAPADCKVTGAKETKLSVVTPEKLARRPNDCVLSDEENAFPFDYSVEQELVAAEPNIFSEDDNVFRYSLSDGSSPDDENVSMLASCNSRQEFNCQDTTDTSVPASKDTLFLPATTYNKVPLLTVPIHPHVPRNHYGGIRDCLPPVQLTRMQAVQPYARSEGMLGQSSCTRTQEETIMRHRAAASVDHCQACGPALSEEQMQKIENNRQAALVKLKARKPDV